MSSTRKWSRMVVALGLAGAMIALPTAAAAQTADEVGDYSGQADSRLLNVNVGTVPDELPLGLVDVNLAPTTSGTDTVGGLSFEGEENLTGFAEATNVFSSIAGEDAIADVVVYAKQTAPPDHEEPKVAQGGAAPENPVVAGSLFTASAHARDAATVACPSDGSLARGYSEVVNGTVLPNAVEEGTGLITLNPTVAAESSQSLAEVDGQSTLGVQSQAVADLTSLNLFGEAEIAVASPPTLTATATGTPGTAGVTYSAPVVTVNGEGLTADDPVRVTIGNTGEDEAIDLPEQLAPIEDGLNEAINQLDPATESIPGIIVEVALGGLTAQQVANDGTSASATASLARVRLLALDQIELASIDLAPMSVEATAPEGGVTCVLGDADEKIDVVKDGPDTVDPGEEFDTTITVTNPFECDIENLTVVDEIVAPDGAEFVSSDPSGADVEETDDGFTVTFDDLGTLPAGESETLTVTLRAPDEAGGSFSDVATASGQCDGEDVEGEGSLDGPDVVGEQGVAGVSDETSMPRTGGGLALVGLIALGVAGALRLAQRRR